MSVCKFMREIKRQTDGTDLDRSLIISTVFYGYATQASNSQYNNASDVPDDKLDATNQYEILEAVLKDTKNGLTKSDFDDIVETKRNHSQVTQNVLRINTNSSGVCAKVNQSTSRTALSFSKYTICKS